MYAQAVCWWTIFRITLEERLVYRGDFALGTLMRFLPIVTQIFLWWAIFETVGQGSRDGGLIEGYTFQNMVAYYLLSMVSRAFLEHAGPRFGHRVADPQWRDQEVSDPAGRLAGLYVAEPDRSQSWPITRWRRCRSPLCSGSVEGFFVDGWPAADVLAAYVLSLFMGFLLGYFLEVTIGLIGFWFLEVSSLLFLYMLLSFFLSGHMFPLDMLPYPWRQLVSLLPLKYLAYFPAAVFLGKVNSQQLMEGLIIEAAWIVGLMVLSRVMYNRGLKRYSGYGG